MRRRGVSLGSCLTRMAALPITVRLKDTSRNVEIVSFRPESVDVYFDYSLTESYPIEGGLSLKDRIAFPDDTIEAGMIAAQADYLDPNTMPGIDMNFGADDGMMFEPEGGFADDFAGAPDESFEGDLLPDLNGEPDEDTVDIGG